METLSKNSLSFCQEDEFCSIIRLSIQFILDELSVLDRQFISSINSDVKVTFNCIAGRCLWLFKIHIPVTANRQQTNQVTFPVRDTTRDSYPKCKLKHLSRKGFYLHKRFLHTRLPTTINELHSKAGLVTYCRTYCPKSLTTSSRTLQTITQTGNSNTLFIIHLTTHLFA